MSRRVIITGCAGFIGSHIAKHHLDAGDIVLGIDDNSSSARDSAHVRDLRSYKLFRLYEGNICAQNTLLNCVNEFKGEGLCTSRAVDIIYNMACPASPPKYQAQPIHTMMTCTLGLKNVLDFALDSNYPIVIHASTSEVYGNPDMSPQKESYLGNVNSFGPRACYDEGKRAGEALCYDYIRMYELDIRLARIFNTYGPNMDPNDGRVVSNFINQALRGEPLTVHGSGNQTRSFCYVSDTVKALVRLGELAYVAPGPINVGNPNEFTISQLAQLVTMKIASTPTGYRENGYTHVKRPVDDPGQRCPDIDLARDVLGWEPKVSLDEGLDATIAYFKSLLK